MDLFCFGCQSKLSAIDEDPNGDMPCKCKRCQAEEAHDYDEDPGAVFSRQGWRMDEPRANDE